MTMREDTPRGICGGLIAAVIILLGTQLAARQMLDSTLFRQSRFITQLLFQDSMEAENLISEPRNLDVLTKFLGAVTAAYIDFEMIPVNEAGTFVAVFESIEQDVTVESFSYHGKALVIQGFAPDESAAEDFRISLERRDHFRAVNLRQYPLVNGGFRYELRCEL